MTTTDDDAQNGSGRDFHLDCFSGLAGDMFLGACLDLGMPAAVLEEAVAALGLEGVSLEVRASARGGLAGTRFRVLLEGEPVEGPDPEERQHGHGHHAHDHDHDHNHGHDHDHDHHDHDHGHDHGHGHDDSHGHDHDYDHDHHDHDQGHGHGHGHDDSHDGHDHHHHHHGHDHGQSQDHDHEDPAPHPPTSAEEPTGGRRLEVRGPDPERTSAEEPGTPDHRPHPDADPEHAAAPPTGNVAGHHPHHGGSRDLPEIRRMIEASSLAPEVKETALNLFIRLGEAEARAHGIPIDRVHFHEVGALDSIVDLVGAAAAYHHLAPRRLTCGRVNVGGGTVQTAHGRLPVPAPATAWLVRGLPVYGGAGGELLTPTGAVILAELVDDFGDLPPMEPQGIGYGLGKKHLRHQPNAVRLTRGRALEAGDAAAGLRVVVLEAQVDDLPGEGFGFLMERLLEEGALDVYFTPVQMKKNRPGTLVTVLARPALREPLAAVLLAESGSLGCRFHEVERLEAQREVETVATPYGEVRVKRAVLAGPEPRRLGAAPEYEDCRRRAREHGVPWRDVYRAALAGC